MRVRFTLRLPFGLVVAVTRSPRRCVLELLWDQKANQGLRVWSAVRY
jgi:hypothetical protein